MDKLEKKHLNVLGTIGGGNHFAEFQEIDEVLDADAFKELEIDQNEVFMLVHSGSRSLGESTLGRFMDQHKGASQGGCKGTPEDSEEFKEYLQGHDIALNFARRNRMLIAHRILEQIDSRKGIEEGQEFAVKDSDCLIDIYHNFVEKQAIKIEEGQTFEGWIHRKGATPSNHSDILVIPGSRGSYSYMVKVIKENCP